MRKLLTASMNIELDLLQQGYQRIIGIDEAGRGAWAGPVAAGAVVLPIDDPDLPLKLAGVRDSKQMTPRQRIRLVENIKNTALTWGVGSATSVEIGQLGIVKATCLAMERALQNAQAAGFQPDYIMTDSIKWLELADKGVPFTSLVRGDQLSLTIAAASVVAKVWRDEHMRDADNHFPGYEFALHKGYGTAKHLAALKKLGATDFHRRGFRPIRDLNAEGGA